MIRNRFITHVQKKKGLKNIVRVQVSSNKALRARAFMSDRKVRGSLQRRHHAQRPNVS